MIKMEHQEIEKEKKKSRPWVAELSPNIKSISSCLREIEEIPNGVDAFEFEKLPVRLPLESFSIATHLYIKPF